MRFFEIFFQIFGFFLDFLIFLIFDNFWKIRKYEKNVKESQKSFFFNKSKFFENSVFSPKKKNAILLVLPIEEISLWPELSTPPCFRIQGGSPERYTRRTEDGGRAEILVSNIGFLVLARLPMISPLPDARSGYSHMVPTLFLISKLGCSQWSRLHLGDTTVHARPYCIFITTLRSLLA